MVTATFIFCDKARRVRRDVSVQSAHAIIPLCGKANEWVANAPGRKCLVWSKGYLTCMTSDKAFSSLAYRALRSTL